MRRLTTLVLSAAALAGAAAPGAAQASRSQLSMIEDDHQFLDSGAAAQARALDEARDLGATTVHVLVRWARLAPAATSATRPDIDLSDPASYGGWAPYDQLVDGAAARGIRLLFTPSG